MWYNSIFCYRQDVLGMEKIMQQGSVVLSTMGKLTSLLKVMGISLSDDFSLTAILCWLQQGIPLLR